MQNQQSISEGHHRHPEGVPARTEAKVPPMARTNRNGDGDGYVWFEDCRVFLDSLQLKCAVDGKIVPLPVLLLHPDCTLGEDGDVGRLGVPRRWAEQHGLLP
jgi:hypothetical protein